MRQSYLHHEAEDIVGGSRARVLESLVDDLLGEALEELAHFGVEYGDVEQYGQVGEGQVHKEVEHLWKKKSCLVKSWKDNEKIVSKSR